MKNNSTKVIKVTKRIPDDLAEFLRIVWSAGIDGHEDWAETESDDMIQMPHIAPVTGGLDNKKNRAKPIAKS